MPAAGEVVLFDRSWYNRAGVERVMGFCARDDYTEAKEAMLFHTDTADASWTIVKADDKKRARLSCMQHFLSSLAYADKDRSIVTGPDPLIVGASAQVIGADKHIIGKTVHPALKHGRATA